MRLFEAQTQDAVVLSKYAEKEAVEVKEIEEWCQDLQKRVLRRNISTWP